MLNNVSRFIEVKRAIFSSITDNEILSAMYSLSILDTKLAETVFARQEINCRFSTCFTRFQTDNFQSIPDFPKHKTITYDPWQATVLGLIVERYQKIRDF